PVDRPTLPRRRRQSGIGCDLSPVVKMAEQSFQPKNRRELRSDTFQTHQHLRWRRNLFLLRRSKHRVSFGLDGPDLFEKQLEPLKLAGDLLLQTVGQGLAIARPQP